MHWKFKALVQNVVALLPANPSYAAYYRLQRNFGALRRITPTRSIHAAVQIARALEKDGGTIRDAEVVEVGSGRRLNLPIFLWLMGARRICTVDLHPYLKEELVAEDVAYLAQHPEEIEAAFSDVPVVRSRLTALANLAASGFTLPKLLELCQIEYRAPADAACLDLPDASIDLHVSTNVFEHIAPEALEAILGEATRIVRPGGRLIHRVDHSDHFSHSDDSLSPVHFLRYSDRRWARLAGNRYMYMNRMQVDDYRAMIARIGLDVTAVEATLDSELLAQLRDADVPLDERFARKPSEVLATVQSLLVARPLAESSAAVAEGTAAA